MHMEMKRIRKWFGRCTARTKLLYKLRPRIGEESLAKTVRQLCSSLNIKNNHVIGFKPNIVNSVMSAIINIAQWWITNGSKENSKIMTHKYGLNIACAQICTISVSSKITIIFSSIFKIESTEVECWKPK